MKKLLFLALLVVSVFALAGCKEPTYEVAMITDAGEIDDESFNQGTWEGIKEFCNANELTYNYYKPAEISDAAYLAAIDLAIEGGAKVVVTPGFLFESSVYAAQTTYPDVKFILIDGEPHTADYSTFETKDNTLPVKFNEHESGYLAGYAAVKDGYTKLGFTGGMAVPAVVKFGIGYIAGAYDAANEMEVDITFDDSTYYYFGGFTASDDYKNRVAGWYDDGTEVVFSAAGGANASVWTAAEEATSDVKVIGVDVDQSTLSDTVITSAMKGLAAGVKLALKDYVDGTFDGGETIYYGAANDGVGLPMTNSKFATFDQAAYDAVYGDIADGTIDVRQSWDELSTYLSATDLANFTEANVAG